MTRGARTRIGAALVAAVAAGPAAAQPPVAAAGAAVAGPPPLPAEVRGAVTEAVEDLVALDLGLDAGLAKGHVLYLYRGDKYLGTATVTDARGLFPKKAVLTFAPARKDTPPARLPADALPRKGDQVRTRRVVD